MTGHPRPSEEELIARFFAPIAAPGACGLKDDAAAIQPRAGYDLVVTADAVVADVHFLTSDPAASIARKALGVNVSDLAAKGAAPVGFVLTLALPDDWTAEWLEQFAAGLGEAASEWGCPLLGGDTVRANGPLSISITALGEVPAGGIVRRTTARAEDHICVSGTIGDAALGLQLLSGPTPPWASSLSEIQRAFLIDRYRHPSPRTRLAPLVGRYASAAMDVSDGLAGDVAKMMRASGVSAQIDLSRLPLSDAARRILQIHPAAMDRIATGGDDYEILFCVADSNLGALKSAAAQAGTEVTVIGQVIQGDAATVFRYGTEEHRFERTSFSHF